MTIDKIVCEEQLILMGAQITRTNENKWATYLHPEGGTVYYQEPDGWYHMYADVKDGEVVYKKEVPSQVKGYTSCQ